MSDADDIHEADAADRLRHALARIARSLRASDAASGLTPTQVSLLGAVVKHGPIGLSELARVEGLNPTMLSRAVGRLEEEGLLHREQVPGDRRAASVAATPAGRRLLRRLRAERSDVLRAQLARLEEDERTRLLDALPALEALARRLRDERGAPVA